MTAACREADKLFAAVPIDCFPDLYKARGLGSFREELGMPGQ